MIRAEDIVKIAPAAAPYAGNLVRQAAEAGIMANQRRISHFLAQIHVESGGFKSVEESLNYAADALINLFGRHRISVADAQKFGRIDAAVRRRTGWVLKDQPAHQNALANILYGGEWGAKNLGNTQAGDGWKFRGRGLKQLTGRDNYRRFSRAWLGDESILESPERVADPDGAVASAVWFWVANGLNEMADGAPVLPAVDVEGCKRITRKVNGGLNGYPDRYEWTSRYAKLWQPRDHNRLRGTAI